MPLLLLLLPYLPLWGDATKLFAHDYVYGWRAASGGDGKPRSARTGGSRAPDLSTAALPCLTT